MNRPTCFVLNKGNVQDLEKLIKKIKVEKASGEDKIPPRLVKMASNFLFEPITDMINTAIDTNTFPDNAKQNKHLSHQLIKVGVISTFTLIIDQLKYLFKNYRISYLSPTYKACEPLFINFCMYGTKHVLIGLLEEWRKQLDHNKIVGTVLLDLSKAFDCIPHDLFIAKLNAYGFDKNTLTLFFSYLKNRKQSIRVKTNYSSFLELLSGIPHDSILGTLLFHIFLNDLFLFIKNASLHNYADDNTLSSICVCSRH